MLELNRMKYHNRSINTKYAARKDGYNWIKYLSS